MINFDTSKNERMIISKIARRAVLLAKEAGISYDTIDAEMDISAVHCNGCQLRLKDLLDADDFNFSHDVFGVRRHINRETGKLEDCFSPRFSVPENQAA